jgi:hypothetical protein
LGDEGVYFISRKPTLGVYLYDGSTFTELTQYNHPVFTDVIDFSKRVFGIYRNRKYYVIYNETGSGVTYPNRMRVYDARFSRCMPPQAAKIRYTSLRPQITLTKTSPQ